MLGLALPGTERAGVGFELKLHLPEACFAEHELEETHLCAPYGADGVGGGLTFTFGRQRRSSVTSPVE